ncbi:hypothetical protein [Pedobacter sp. KBW06]|uniref:hypothetical protein n=1 Tax=Pedobacter sp. KBW06 TaxID=2153359 RepID=UPI000F5AF0F5|nr:hypothetical protein [Pedobacter sp. KBW06]
MNNKIEQIPSWMKAMQNGNLAEARARAFLMNRFWILERSIDINGADFLIQRRLTNSNFLDDKAPRLGVVQVKFFDSPATTQKIHKEYVIDDDGKPRTEFFVLLHSGNEEQEEMYFLTAQDVCRDFELKRKDGIDKYHLPGNKIIGLAKYRVIVKKLILDRIEHYLQLADFAKNRKFISWSLPGANVDPDHIMPDFKEPIPNWYGSIPEAFYNTKEAARESLLEISKAYDMLTAVVEESDPIRANDVLEEIKREFNTERGLIISLSRKLDDYSFREVCKKHKNQLEDLRNHGLLDAFLSLKGFFRKILTEFLQDKMPLEKNLVHAFSFKINENLAVVDLRHSLDEFEVFKKNKEHISEISESAGLAVLKNRAKEFLVYWRPKVFLKDMNVKEYFENEDLFVYRATMEAIYDERYYVCDYTNLEL